MVPAHIDEVLPVNLIEGVLLDDGELLSKNLGVEGEDERNVTSRHEILGHGW